MKEIFLLASLLGWASPIFAQLPLVSAYRDERIGKDFDNVTPRDWQNFFRPDFMQFLVSREGRLATSGGAVGEVLYYYRNSAPGSGHRPLRKPIIVLDGFDPRGKWYARLGAVPLFLSLPRPSTGPTSTWPTYPLAFTWCGSGWPTRSPPPNWWCSPQVAV
jgi:hypothetical protein